jgi:septal ring factor EnvC (AmiA/AmiB activator)
MMDEDRRAVLVSLQHERQEAEKALARLQTNEERLRELLADMERQRKYQVEQSAQSAAGQSSFARQTGSLDWPVDGEVVRGFGRSVHPEYKTVTLNNGINIAAPQGSPVYAVAEGSVEFADHLPGFGVCVILDHGAGYYSLYAHLDRLFVTKASQVHKNEILAEVGEAVEGGGSQLYFEIRQGKTPLDPTQWLRSRSRPR